MAPKRLQSAPASDSPISQADFRSLNELGKIAKTRGVDWALQKLAEGPEKNPQPGPELPLTKRQRWAPARYRDASPTSGPTTSVQLKTAGGVRGSSVNEGLAQDLCSVQYTTFDEALGKLQKLGKGTLMADADIETDFRLLPVHPEDNRLLGFTFKGQYFLDLCMPMRCSIACSVFESFSRFLEWTVKDVADTDEVVHYLDDFLFMGTAGSTSKGVLDPTKDPRVRRAIMGWERMTSRKEDTRRPIDAARLARLVMVLARVCSPPYELSLFHFAYSLAFFGAFRKSELIADSKSVLGSGIELSNVIVTDSSLCVKVRRSKMDLRGKGTWVCLGSAQGTTHCPVVLAGEFLRVRPEWGCSKLLIHENGCPLTRYQFTRVCKCALAIMGRRSLGSLRIPFALAQPLQLMPSGGLVGGNLNAMCALIWLRLHL
ncbi:hypothetical protein NDU88_006904 [Pleurodeles waltl]|uniref:Reverse transcriptase domain-containing protein n=1 Tax=Pleurodeles waltl TaxID=8319 RepID=A0AAV7QN99_PLEWA|nr:hypothetical protein NDU88_006904 [Pleurodeles waltl]